MTLEQLLAYHHERREIVAVDEPTVKLVLFELNDRAFAVLGECIREIVADADIYLLPGAPPALAGVINVRGEIESVLLPRVLLGLPAADSPAAGMILIGQGSDLRSGVQVDQVTDVRDVPRSLLQDPPESLPEEWRPFVLKLALIDDRPVTVLDLDRLFAAYRDGVA